MRGSRKPNSARPHFLKSDSFRHKLIAELACTIMAQWQLDDTVQFQLSGLQCRFEFQMWKQKAFTMLSSEVYLRLTALLELNRLITAKSSSPKEAAMWLRTANLVFDHNSPLDHILDHGFDGIQDICNALYSDEPAHLNRTYIH